MRGDKVRNHPNVKMINRFFINGRTPEYVAYWLSKKYPIIYTIPGTLKYNRLPNNKKLNISVKTLEMYRNQFMFDLEKSKHKPVVPDKIKFRNSRLAEVE